MRASRDDAHLSGAERLVDVSTLEKVAAEMTRRALQHAHGQADCIRISIDLVSPDTVLILPLPAMTTIRVPDFRSGRTTALNLLKAAGVAMPAAESALAAIAGGASPSGGNMRGAMLVDAVTGERLEPDSRRGIRVSRMDLTPEAERELRLELEKLGLDRPQVREALVLSGKVLAAPGVVAELCWSDDPDYPAGYVAAPQAGYVRIPALKPLGDNRGGRAFFVRGNRLDLPGLINFLECRPVLFDRPGRFHPDRDMER